MSISCHGPSCRFRPELQVASTFYAALHGGDGFEGPGEALFTVFQMLVLYEFNPEQFATGPYKVSSVDRSNASSVSHQLTFLLSVAGMLPPPPRSCLCFFSW